MKRAKVSYVKKPFARRSLIAFGLAICALVMGAVGLLSSVRSNGEVPLNIAAVCFCSLVVALVSLVYGGLSFLEKEKKYILARISLVTSGFLVIIWVVLIIIGSKG